MWYQAFVSGSIASGLVLVDFLLGLPSKPRSTRTQAAFHSPTLPPMATRAFLVHTSRAKPCVCPHCTPKETEAPRGVKSVTQVQFCPSPGSVSKKGIHSAPWGWKRTPKQKERGEPVPALQGLVTALAAYKGKQETGLLPSNPPPHRPLGHACLLTSWPCLWDSRSTFPPTDLSSELCRPCLTLICRGYGLELQVGCEVLGATSSLP